MKTLCDKGEIARNEQFLFFPQCTIFVEFKLSSATLSVWKSLNSSFGKGLTNNHGFKNKLLHGCKKSGTYYLNKTLY